MDPEVRKFLLELAKLALEHGVPVGEDDPREEALQKLAALRVSGGQTGGAKPPTPEGFGFSS
jgi:hypothetical protein